MDIVLLLKSIGFGFLMACVASILLALGIVTLPFATFGFIPVWIVAAIFWYQDNIGKDAKEREKTTKRQTREGVGSSTRKRAKNSAIAKKKGR